MGIPYESAFIASVLRRNISAMGYLLRVTFGTLVLGIGYHSLCFVPITFMTWRYDDKRLLPIILGCVNYGAIKDLTAVGAFYLRI